MIRVGIVGMGFMGWVHWLSYQQMRGMRVAAICSRNPRKLAGDWRDIRGNFGPPGEKVQLNGAAAYSELDQLLAKELHAESMQQLAGGMQIPGLVQALSELGSPPSGA